MPDVYDNVSVVDWHALTDGRAELLWEDGIHPTTEGRELLAAAVAQRVGEAPEGSEGRCLDSNFTDDSAGTIDGRPAGSSTGSGSSGSGSTSRTTTTIAQGGVTTTTVRPNGPTTTVANTGPTTTSATGGTATTSPTQTTSPAPNTTVTNPPAPPTTAPEVPAASISNG